MTNRDVEVELCQRTALGRVFVGGRFSSPQRLSGGISSGATRWDVGLPDGGHQRAVVRTPSWDSGVAQQRLLAEARVLTLVRDLSVPVPHVHGLDLETGSLVLEYLEGEPSLTTPASEEALRQLARALAAVHRITARDHDLSFLPDRSQSAQRLIEQPPVVLDDELQESRVRSALAERRRGSANPPSLLHGDYWPGNVLWRKGELVAIIDWEEAEVGDPLADLAIARLDVLWAFGTEAMHRFTALYVSLNPLAVDQLPFWDLIAALRPMSHLERWASAYAAPPISRPDVTAASMGLGHRAFVEQALRGWAVT